jgi:phospholipase C
MMKTNGLIKIVLLVLAAFIFVSCQPPAPTPQAHVPVFDHIILLVFENKGYENVIGNPDMPTFNKLAQENTLLTQYYAVTHPSLPNYIAMIGGDTFGITSDCENCFLEQKSLPDLIEASGRTWKTYQESMPSPCFVGSADPYAQKHNPFIYFNPIRLDTARCERSVVPETALQTDLEAGTLPNFALITPNLCDDAHNCSLKISDAWLTDLLGRLVPALDAKGKSYLIVLMFEEGKDNGSCCGLPFDAGGRVPVVLYSPLVKKGFEDATPYTHYSLLKTISTAWGLPLLGHAADSDNVLITAPWK